jgi:chaperonin GroEL
MTHTQLLLKDQARAKLLAGATALADALRLTLGPKSKCVLVARAWDAPLVCNDGVTIAKSVDLADPVENLGARMLREAAVRTADAVGDGTTTATILAHAIYVEGLRNVVAGASAIELKRGLDKGLVAAVDALRKLSRPVSSRKEKAQVATISAHNDPEIGELIAEAMEKVGPEGVVSIEEAKGTETLLEVVEGLQFDRGYLSPYFVTNSGRMEAVLEDALILLSDKRISTLADLLPILEQTAKMGRPFLVVAEDVDSDVLATLVINKLRGTLSCVAVKAPGYGDRRKELLRDIAAVVGGQPVIEEFGVKLANVRVEDLGSARRVVVDKDTTTIIGGAGDKQRIADRCAEVRRALLTATSDYEREKLEERLAKLSGGVAVVRVGANTEAEMKNRKEAFDDAVHSAKAAMAEGIVAGGGLALIRVVDALAELEKTCAGDELTGVRILERALEAPTRQIVENSGGDGGVVVARMREQAGASVHLGYDAARREFRDMFEAGIVDPTKVVRVGLENAVSIAGVLLLAEGTLTQIEEKKPHEQDSGEPRL